MSSSQLSKHLNNEDHGSPGRLTVRGPQEDRRGQFPKQTLIHLLNEHEVAEILGVSVATVRRWRLLDQGPKYMKVGAAVRYKPENVMDWIDSRPSGGQQATEPL